MADVFISYSHENREAARILAETITDKGYNVWWDRELVAGDDYTDIIEETLDTAKAVIVIWSEKSRKSYWVRDEAAVGRDRNRLLPVTIDDNPPPLGFRQIHTVSLKGWDGKSEGPLEDIWHGLAGLVGPVAGEIAPEPEPEGTNPFGGDAPAKRPKPKDSESKKIFAGVNAAPVQKSMEQIKKEEKRQRSFTQTFWLTSFIVSGIISVIMGIYAEFTVSFAEEGWWVYIIVGFFFVGLGLMIGRFLILVGRRLSKRKSVLYFDTPTNWCIGISIVLGLITMASMLTVEDEVTGELTALSDVLFMAPVFVFTFFFPICALVSLIIGAIKGPGRKSFQDGD